MPLNHPSRTIVAGPSMRAVPLAYQRPRTVDVYSQFRSDEIVRSYPPPLPSQFPRSHVLKSAGTAATSVVGVISRVDVPSSGIIRRVRLPLASCTVAVPVRPVVIDFQTTLPPLNCHVPSNLPGFSVADVAWYVPSSLNVMVSGQDTCCPYTVPLHVVPTPLHVSTTVGFRCTGGGGS